MSKQQNQTEYQTPEFSKALGDWLDKELSTPKTNNQKCSK